MSDLTDLVRAELCGLADSDPVPLGLADRALAGARRRHRRRLAAVAVAGVLIVALLANLPLVLPSRRQPTAVVPNRNVIYATRLSDNQPWQILQPATGRYRAVDVASVSAPTADLRYAAVTPQGDQIDRRVALQPQGRTIGRYESASGDIQWFPLPVVIIAPAIISPDGRYAVAVHLEAQVVQLLLLDLRTGESRLLDVAASDALLAASQEPPAYGFMWQSDSRHLIRDNRILDLEGHQTGVLPVPRDTMFTVARPDGSGLLVRPSPGKLYLRRDAFLLTDRTGAVIRQAVVEKACTNSRSDAPASAGPWSSGAPHCNYSFLDWRGSEQILVRDDTAAALTALELDLRTGAVHQVRPPVDVVHGAALVTAPVTNPADVTRSATF
jgi:hypothetical protein